MLRDTLEACIGHLGHPQVIGGGLISRGVDLDLNVKLEQCNSDMEAMRVTFILAQECFI